MKKVVLVMAALAVMCYSLPAFSAGTCQDWKGVWNFQYDNDSSAIICYDNESLTACDPADNESTCKCVDVNTPQLCVDNDSTCTEGDPGCVCFDNPAYRTPTVAAGTYEVKITSVVEVVTAGGLTLNCVALGKRTTDSQDIAIVQPDNNTIDNIPAFADVARGSYLYFEATYGTDNLTIKSFAQIPPADFTGDNFTANPDLNLAGLVNGTRTGDLTCTDLDNCTNPCALQVYPDSIGFIRKITTFVEPLRVFAIVGTGDPAFVKGDKAEFSGDSIVPLIQIRIGSRIIIALTFVRPLKLVAGDIDVTVGDCVGTITVK